jgi:hypothetical protein
VIVSLFRDRLVRRPRRDDRDFRVSRMVACAKEIAKDIREEMIGGSKTNLLF